MTEDGVRAAARDFLAWSFGVLQREHVLPAPHFNAHLEVGRDYFGPDLEGAPRFELEDALNSAFPERFGDPLTRPDPQFASAYVFDLLQRAIVLCAVTGDYDADGKEVATAIDELLESVAEAEFEVVCCRVVSHLTTVGMAETDFGEVEIHAERDDDRDSLLRQIAELIPTAPSELRRAPFVFDRPHALVIARCSTRNERGWEVAQRLSRRIDRFLMSLRIVHSATVHAHYEVTGPSRTISHFGPNLVTFNAGGWAPLRRPAKLGEDDAAGLGAVQRLIDDASVNRSKMVATSYDVALQKFHNAPYRSSAFEQLVDLATALEAILLGGDKSNDEVTLRLRTRAARLLCTDRDPATSIFDDVGLLYGLRSSIVHGGDLKEKDLRRYVERLSTAVSSDGFGIAIARAADRLSDLVRRSLLARLCLSSEPNALWSLGTGAPIDRLLVDDATAAAWRSHWHAVLRGVGAEQAIDRPKAAADFLDPYRHDSDDSDR
jgi:hypothetical protein